MNLLVKSKNEILKFCFKLFDENKDGVICLQDLHSFN